MVWLALAGAIVTEVSGTISLRMATTGPSPKRIWYLPVAVGYVLAFTLLSVTLALGLPLGIAYGIWAAVGVALTAVLGRLLFREPLTPVMALGILLIGAGVVLVELGAAH
ncbi:QacE family quaternary ammonium compound efflux SMR transporter [Leifsonia sp. ZF2019]|uniref:DMT family transporter n=1 Tax=unclassified Leifsonia TaxID=2663824 RepID=UPI001CBBCB8D|nr:MULTISPECIES: SMR family transporter [unclassified Leifsonia]UAJ81634.1 QacE family quaternary ammonium compound efflux SMR transporter [Leifsonia sp. ZF2019]